MATKDKPVKAKKLPSLSRRILFYTYDRGKDDAGKRVGFNAAAAFQSIEELPWTTEGKYLDWKTGELLYCRGVLKGEAIRAALGLSRRSDWPLNERGGQHTELELPDNSGLAELSHMVFFPEDAIVGVEYNHHGARVSSALPLYLAKKVPEAAEGLRFYELLRGDVEQDLKRLGQVFVFRLRLYGSRLDEAAAVDENLADALRGAASAGQAEDLEIILRKGNVQFTDRMMQWARRIAGRAKRQEEFHSVEIKGKDEETKKQRAVNILKDTLVFEADIERRSAKSKAVDPQAAYSHIESIYAQNREALLNAAQMEFV